MQKDEIVIQLSNILKNFLEFFTNELQKKVLALDTNIKSDSYYNQLKRVSNSLEQYIKKDVSLFYVGFLGSYSSGKSSTINSLLDIWDTDKKRTVSNNPTDDCITLITNQKNVSSVFTFAKEGAISIRTVTNFENEFLDNIVLMDTPGSGDPNIVDSIVRDSLPLCDLIIYTLNATAPFTDIDKPFLVAQQSKLKNIPLLFVLTRGDEFKTTKSGEINTNNFDTAKYQIELQTLITRINEAINISDFNTNDFIIIDNLNHFNLDILKERIYKFTSNNDENLIILHNHKLSYFKKEIDEIHRFYLELTNTKIDKCVKFIEKANSNIEYFNKQIEVSKVKFRSIWNDYSQKFARIFDGIVKGYLENLLIELNQIKPFESSSDYQFLKDELIKILKIQSEIKSNSIIKEIEEKSFEKITTLKQDLMDIINYDTLNISLSNDNKEYSFVANLNFPIDILSFSKDFINKGTKYTNEKILSLNNVYSQISKSLKSLAPIDKINDNIQNYKIAAIDVLEIYYEAVKMYNVAAFSYEVKNYISDLGLAKEFDQIESVEIDKIKYNLIAENALLNNILSEINKYTEDITIISNQTELLSEKIKEIKSFNYEKTNYEEIKINNLNNTKNIENISEFVNVLYQNLVTNIQNKLFNLKEEVRTLKKKRRNKYIISIAFSAVFVLAIYYTYNYLYNKVVPNNIWASLIIGVSTSIIATFITRIFDKYKNYRKLVIDDFKTKLFQENSEIVNNYYSDFKKNNIKLQKEIANNVYSGWKINLDEAFDSMRKSTITTYESKISELKTKVKVIVENYSTKYTYFNKIIIDYFNDYDNNIIKINKIATQIKDESIEPSFKLLTNTLNEIKSVKNEIELLKNI